MGQAVAFVLAHSRLLPAMIVSSRRPIVPGPHDSSFGIRRTGERTELTTDALEGEVVPCGWSPDGKHLLLAQSWQAVQHLFIYDIESQTLGPLSLPGGSLGWGPPFASFAYYGSGEEIFAHWENLTHPLSLIAFSSTTGEQTRIVLSAGSVPAGEQWRSITFLSSDGKTIQGWLALPDGQGPFPTILGPCMALHRCPSRNLLACESDVA